MTTADQIRAFADTGTPADRWRIQQGHNGSNREVHTQAPSEATRDALDKAWDALVEALGVTA